MKGSSSRGGTTLAKRAQGLRREADAALQAAIRSPNQGGRPERIEVQPHMRLGVPVRGFTRARPK